jgi:hypothetical protein
MTARHVTDLDEARHAWIVAHQGVSTIQRRRAETLGRKTRARQRIAASAIPDAHDDTVIPPLWLRAAKSPASHIEMLVVATAGVVAPAGWLAGLVLKRIITSLIPRTLRAFPTAALLWSAVVLGAAIVLMYRPTGSLMQMFVAPWLCLQLAAIPATAGVYGIAEGWLAVDGSDSWWPLMPPQRPITAQEAAAILGDANRFSPRSSGTATLRILDEGHCA